MRSHTRTLCRLGVQRVEPGPGRQRELPAGFFEADPGRDRLTAPGSRVFGGFEEDMSGADDVRQIVESSDTWLSSAVRFASVCFVPRFTMRVKIPVPLALRQVRVSFQTACWYSSEPANWSGVRRTSRSMPTSRAPLGQSAE